MIPSLLTTTQQFLRFPLIVTLLLSGHAVMDDSDDETEIVTREFESERQIVTADRSR
jgi:hypothetical protein